MIIQYYNIQISMSIILYAGNSEMILEENFNNVTEIHLQLNPQIAGTIFNDEIRNQENIILTQLPIMLERIEISLVMENVDNIDNIDSYYLFNNLPINLKYLSVVLMTHNINNKKNNYELIKKKIMGSANFKIPFGCTVRFVALWQNINYN